MRKLVLIMTVMAPMFFNTAEAKTKTMRMSIQLPETDAAGMWARIVFKDAFKRMKVPLEIVTLPENRSYSEIMEGNIDGELARAEQYAQAHPDLVRVKIPSVRLNTVAYSTVPIESAKDLRNTKLRVDYKIGNPVAKAALSGLEPSDRISTLSEDLQGFEKLASGRTEVYIGYDASTVAILKTHPELARKIKFTKVIASFEVYSYFPQKNKDFAQKLEKVLQQMAETGDIDKDRQQAEEQVEADIRRAHPTEGEPKK